MTTTPAREEASPDGGYLLEPAWHAERQRLASLTSLDDATTVFSDGQVAAGRTVPAGVATAAPEDPRRRAQAGVAVVDRLGESGVDQTVINLVRDPDDTPPTAETTLARLQRGDQPAVT